MKKAQAAYEFMMIFFMISIGFTFWVAFASSFQENIQVNRNIELMNDFSLSLKHDIYLVAQMHDGFTRQINIPTTILSNRYEIGNQNNNQYNFSTIFVNNTEIGYYTQFDVPLLDGDIKKGELILEKHGNKIIIS
jgi:hypothetical protein